MIGVELKAIGIADLHNCVQWIPWERAGLLKFNNDLKPDQNRNFIGVTPLCFVRGRRDVWHAQNGRVVIPTTTPVLSGRVLIPWPTTSFGGTRPSKTPGVPPNLSTDKIHQAYPGAPKRTHLPNWQNNAELKTNPPAKLAASCGIQNEPTCQIGRVTMNPKRTHLPNWRHDRIQSLAGATLLA